MAFGFAGCSTEGGGTAEGEVCQSTEEFFANSYFKVINTKCGSCHQVGSVGAEQSDFDLHPSAEAGFLEQNLEAMRKIAGVESNGRSVLLAKPLGDLDHGGGAILKTSDKEYQDLEALIQRFQEGDDCPNTEARYLAGVELMGPEETVRKAALVLASRLPTVEEIEKVQSGGWDAVGPLLDQFMSEEAFYTRLKEKYNDITLTDFYLNDGQFDIIGDNDLYAPRWYEDVPATEANLQKYGAANADEMYNKLERWTQQAVAQQSLELIAYVIRQNRPFTEVLTADYMVVNPFSAQAYRMTDVEFENDANRYEFKEGKLGGYDYGFPHAGVLSDPIWLARHPTTDTNRNRHRAKEVLYVWMANDILKAAERPLDITKVDRKQNPTRNQAECSVCHNVVDPIAGAFRNFQNDEQFLYDAENPWFDEMFAPGFKGKDMPPDDYSRALPWLSKQVVADNGFAYAAVNQGFRLVMGYEPVQPPKDLDDPEFSSKLTAYLGQYYTLSKIAQRFRSDTVNFNFKTMVKDLVMSPFFRAKNAAPQISEEQLTHLTAIGTAHLLTPEQLNRKLNNVLGMSWTPAGDIYATPNLLQNGGSQGYRMLFGGIDSQDVTVRITSPNGIMANVIERMGLEMGCRAVSAEFSLPMADRKLFTSVDPTHEPQDANGYDIPESVQLIKQNIKFLHERLLGEKLEDGDPELERTYRLFLETWQEGKGLVNSGMASDSMPWECRPEYNYLTGERFAEEDPMVFDGDALYTGCAWMTVMTYLLTDYSFVYE